MCSSNDALYELTIEGYRFCRSDGEPFDASVTTFVPPTPTDAETNMPNAIVYRPALDTFQKDEMADLFHECDHHNDTDMENAATTKRFILAHRCDPTWDTLSDQQRDAIEKIENEVDSYRQKGILSRFVILEGLGGCGKTRLMAYVINHSPNNTHVLYLTKQNKRLQDFLYNELDKGELIAPQPVLDMTKCVSEDFFNLQNSVGGRYACSVEKLVYNVVGREEARETNHRNTLQWKMKIPDELFVGDKIKTNKSNVVVFLDEYTMISPPLLHKMLQCVELLFSAPTVLIMGGDRFQLGPINWDERSDRKFKDKCGEEAPPNSVTRNNQYYVSDVREELKKRLNQEPFEYHMVGSQRCRDDPYLAKMVVYLRNACQSGTSIKAVERRMAAFGHARGIHMFRYDQYRQGCQTGLLVFKSGSDDCLQNKTDSETAVDDEDDEDRHLGDDDLRDTSVIEIDWSSPPTVDLTPFIDFYARLYEDIYLGYTERTLHNFKLPMFVYEKASAFACDKFPIFMVKKNDKCNLLSDTFLKTLYNGVYSELTKKYSKKSTEPKIAHAGGESEAKRLKLSHQTLDIETVLQRLCVSISVSNVSPVQQTIMVGVPYRMTDTLKCVSEPVVSNGELVLLTAIEFNEDLSINGVFLKTLQRRTDHLLLVRPGLTRNRLTNASGKQEDFEPSNTYMLPMVPMICENIYQMQGNTIVSDCFVDLVSTKIDDIYVAVSRFRKTNSIKGVVMTR